MKITMKKKIVIKLKGIHTYSRELIVKIILPPFWKAYSKRNEFAPVQYPLLPLGILWENLLSTGANSFLLN